MSTLEQARTSLDDPETLARVLDDLGSEDFFELLDAMKAGERWPRLLAAAGPDLRRRLVRWTPRMRLGRPPTCEAFCEAATRFLRERSDDVPAFSPAGLVLETIGFCAQGGRLTFSTARWKVVVLVEMAEVGPAEAIHEETWLIDARSDGARYLFACDASDARRTAAWLQSLPLDAHPFQVTEARQR